jgi:hypothetical protein
MNNQEAIHLLERELASFRDETYGDLVRRMPAGSMSYERSGASGTMYQPELQFFWDDQPAGNIRVIGSIDDGGWRAFCSTQQVLHQSSRRLVRGRVTLPMAWQSRRGSDKGRKDVRYRLVPFVW